MNIYLSSLTLNTETTLPDNECVSLTFDNPYVKTIYTNVYFSYSAFRIETTLDTYEYISLMFDNPYEGSPPRRNGRPPLPIL